MRVQLQCSSGRVFHGDITKTIYDAITWKGRTFVFTGEIMTFRGGDELHLYEEVVPFAVVDDTMKEGKYPGVIEGFKQTRRR